MMHTALYYEQLVTDVYDVHRARLPHLEHPARDRVRPHPVRARRRRLRRASAALLVRTAERLAQQPADAILPRPVTPPSAGCAHRPATG